LSKPIKPIVILAPRITDDSKSIWRCCLDQGWSPQRLQNWRVPQSIIDSEAEIMIYGEPLFAEAIVDQLGYALLEPSIDWLTKLDEKYSKRHIRMMTLAEARSIDYRCFVKPADGKIFDPKVYHSGKELPTEESVDLSIPVLISDVIDYRLEVRCFVRGRKIVTHSPYWRDDSLAQDDDGGWPYLSDEEEEALSFANEVLCDASVELPPACTLDVGLSSGGEWSVIEANPCWGAGLYGCDPMEVLLTIGSAIKNKSDLIDEDKLWVLERS